MSSDFSLTRLYRRLWSDILRNGLIIAIIRLVKLALLKCFPGLSESGLDADMVCHSCEASMAGGRG